MKKSLTVLLVIFTLTAFSQDKSKSDRFDKIKALKVAFITKELSLTSAEAEKFWPVYNTYDEKLFELRHTKMKAILKKIKEDELDKLNEKEAAAILTQIETIDEEILTLRKKFAKDAKEIIGAKKVLKLKKVEEDFNRTLLKQYKGKGDKGEKGEKGPK